MIPPPPPRPGPHTPLQMMIIILIVMVMNVTLQWSPMIRIRKTMSFIYFTKRSFLLNFLFLHRIVASIYSMLCMNIYIKSILMYNLCFSNVGTYLQTNIL